MSYAPGTTIVPSPTHDPCRHCRPYIAGEAYHDANCGIRKIHAELTWVRIIKQKETDDGPAYLVESPTRPKPYFVPAEILDDVERWGVKT